MLDEGWDPIPAYMVQMIRYSQKQSAERRITREKIESFAQNIRFYDGVTRMFKSLTDFVAKTDDAFRLELYIISSGIGDMIRNSKIAKSTADIFASDFAYNAQGEIEFPKKVVSFTDKTRYIFQISKGLVGEEYRNKPFEVNNKIDSSALRIPMENIVFIGDGYTDVPCFSLLKKNNGTAFAVYDKDNPEKMHKAWRFVDDGRVKNLHSVNYRKGSDLMSSIEMSIHNIIMKNKFGYRE